MSGVIIAMIISLIILIIGVIGYNTPTLKLNTNAKDWLGIMGTIGLICFALCLTVSMVQSNSSNVTIYTPTTITRTADGITVVSYMNNKGNKDNESILQTITTDKAPVYIAPDTNIKVKNTLYKNHWNCQLQEETEIYIKSINKEKTSDITRHQLNPINPHKTK